MTAKPRTTAPSDLKPRGKSLWRAVIGKYTLDPAEGALLHELCRTTDELDALTAALADQEPVVAGSKGQPRANPLLAEIRQHRRVAETLVVGLALPVDGETVGQRRSVDARAAAQARWRAGKGA